jgi:hypothetical protein
VVGAALAEDPVDAGDAEGVEVLQPVNATVTIIIRDITSP